MNVYGEILVKDTCTNILTLDYSCSFSTLSFYVQVLSSHLMHSSLPGLTRLEQMFLVALADTVATTSAEVPSSTDQQYTGKLNICMGQSKVNIHPVPRLVYVLSYAVKKHIVSSVVLLSNLR